MWKGLGYPKFIHYIFNCYLLKGNLVFRRTTDFLYWNFIKVVGEGCFRTYLSCLPLLPLFKPRNLAHFRHFWKRDHFCENTLNLWSNLGHSWNSNFWATVIFYPTYRFCVPCCHLFHRTMLCYSSISIFR